MKTLSFLAWRFLKLVRAVYRGTSCTWLLLLGLPLGSAAGAAPEAEAKPARYVLGLSPFLERTVKDDVYRRIASFLLESVPLGSAVEILDAYHLRTITRVEVPRLRAFQSPKTRANQFSEPIRRVREFLAAEHARPAERSGTSETPETAGSRVPLERAVRLPQFADFVAENFATSNRALVLIVLGDPLYRDAREPGFSMVQGYFPSDGHLHAARAESVFGIKDRSGSLTGAVVHLAFFGDPWVSDVHAEKVTRFWSLFFKGQGAELGAFSGDLPSVFAGATGDLAPMLARNQRYAIDPAARKLEMLRVTRDIGAHDWITRDLLPNAAQPPPSVLSGRMKIGIRWKGDLDLDLYSRPRPGAPELFFENTRMAEGYYFKDHRSSPDREYEFIEYEQPVDVRAVAARINFYEGESEGATSGEIRIEFDGRIYSGSFTIPARQGNEGREGPGQAKFWTQIDLLRILRLESGPVARRE